MSYAKNVAMSREIYAAMEDELADIDQTLGFTKQRRLPHRQYLTYDVGPGTYSQRQKAYAQHRLYEAIDNVYEKQFEKALRNPNAKEVAEYKGKTKKFKPKVTKALEIIAHEKIRDSMGRGEFKNLKGMGKPLRREHDNPVIDDMQQKLNRLLSNAGFAPEWISLDKEIRQSIENVKECLSTCWSKCGPHPMTPERMKVWEQELEELSQSVRTINKKISDLNLIVPSLSAQRTYIRLDLLVSKVTAEPPSSLKHSQIEGDSTSEERTFRVSDSASNANELDQTTNSAANSTSGSGFISSIMRTFDTWLKLWQRRK
jgi:DnaJ family protein C protein 28